MERKENSLISVDFARNINHYSENIKKILGDSNSQIRRLTPDEIHQIDSDLKSFKHNLELGSASMKGGDIQAYQNEYEQLVLKRNLTLEISELSEAA